jgi:hypothetical protein
LVKTNKDSGERNKVRRQTWNEIPVGKEIPVRYIAGKYDKLKPIGNAYLNPFILTGLILTVLGLCEGHVHFPPSE